MFEALEERALFSTQAPFAGSPIAIPGTIQAENYDNGGDGVSYHDTTAGNTGGKYRTGDNVDIISSGTGYAVGYIQAGEWLEYTINITTAGTYRIDASVAAGSSGGGTFHVSVDGTDKTGADFQRHWRMEYVHDGEQIRREPRRRNARAAHQL